MKEEDNNRDKREDETDEEYAYRMEEETGYKGYHYGDTPDDDGDGCGLIIVAIALFVLGWLFA